MTVFLDSAPPLIFLTAAEIPPNLLRLRPGERLRWRDPALPPRCVERVGYRKRAGDYAAEADCIAPRAQFLLRQETGVAVEPQKLRWLLMRGLCQQDGLGGPDRGVVMRPSEHFPLDDVEVIGTRCVQVGFYYPGGGSGEGAEPGGIENRRTIVLVRIQPVGWAVPPGGFWYLSGDFCRAEEK